MDKITEPKPNLYNIHKSLKKVEQKEKLAEWYVYMFKNMQRCIFVYQYIIYTNVYVVEV